MAVCDGDEEECLDGYGGVTQWRRLQQQSLISRPSSVPAPSRARTLSCDAGSITAARCSTRVGLKASDCSLARSTHSDHTSCPQGSCSSCCVSRDCRLKYKKQVLVTPRLLSSPSPPYTHKAFTLCPHNHTSITQQPVRQLSLQCLPTALRRRRRSTSLYPPSRLYRKLVNCPSRTRTATKCPFNRSSQIRIQHNAN